MSCSRPSVCEEIGFCDCEDRDWIYSTPEERITLPAIDDAAVLTYHGEMARIGDSWMTLMDAV